MRKKISLFQIITLIAIPVFLIVAFLVVNELNKDDLSPEQFSAIYGGKVETGYPYAGYLVGYEPNNRINVCGVAIVSENTGITAGHCIISGANIFIGEGNFSYTKIDNFLASDIQVHPKWLKDEAQGFDLATIKINPKIISLEVYSSISTPINGCDYEIVGYGATENDIASLGANRPRKSTGICINSVNNKTFEFTGIGGGICFGDSGSPVYVKGTNKLVGIVSAIISSNSETSQYCHINNKGIATRVDNPDEFSLHYEYENRTPVELNFAICGGSCQQKECAKGLVCNDKKVCHLLDNMDCISTLDNYCSRIANILCEDGSSCINNKCIKRDDVNAAETTAFINETISYFNSNPTTTIAVVIIVGIIMSATIFFSFKR